MCGICGVFKYANTKSEVTRDLVVRMRDAMVHRGPDDAGAYIPSDGKVWLGHRHLGIVDQRQAKLSFKPDTDSQGIEVMTVNNIKVASFA
jgi:asparagine synthase (glutamine-hydrolysing)